MSYVLMLERSSDCGFHFAPRCWQTLVADVAAFPGVIIGLSCLKYITAKQLQVTLLVVTKCFFRLTRVNVLLQKSFVEWLQAWGFLSLAVIFLILGLLLLPSLEIESHPAGRWTAFALVRH